MLWQQKSAGVASHKRHVTAIPASLPFRFARSMIVVSGFPSGSTPTAWYFVLCPVANAVPPAPESVMSLSVQWVADSPMYCALHVGILCKQARVSVY